MHVYMFIKEFVQDLKTQKTRAILTIVAITWGTLAVVLLMSFGFGLSRRVNIGMRNAGDRCIRIYGGQTRKIYKGLPVGRNIRLTLDDYRLIKNSIPLIDGISAQLGNWVRLRNGEQIASTYMEGVFPDFEFLRNLPPGPGGRFINQQDMEERKRVVFMGSMIFEEFFGKADPIGKTIHIDGTPFKIIGIMPKKMQMGMNNGPDDRRAIIPFTTFQTIYGDRYLNELIVKPVSVEFNKKVIQDVRKLLSTKYQFDPEDEYALPTWDHVENEKIMDKMFLGINIFLGILGTMSLVIAGVGVANIMYVVVKERTREIGIKRAVGAKKRHIISQFIFESLLIAGIGGFLGFIISTSLIKLMWMMPADEGVMQFLGRPLLSSFVFFITIAVLVLISLMAGFFPARKAANVDPVEALRYE